MLEQSVEPTRFIGMDIHKNFCVAIGVNRKLETVYGAHKIYTEDLAR